MNTDKHRFIFVIGVYMCLSVVSIVHGAAASFPHGQKDHRKIECRTCHSVSPQKPDVQRYPGHEACASCHKFGEESTKREQTFCLICHFKIPESSVQPALFAFPKPGIKTDFGLTFPHASHLKSTIKKVAPAAFSPQDIGRAMKCSDCHIKKAISGGVKTSPELGVERAHANCFRCHGQKPEHVPAMNQCAGCHAIDGPGVPNLFGIVKEFRHSDHVFDTRPKKRADLIAKKKIDLCSECHSSVVQSMSLAEVRLPETSTCLSCHTGKPGLPRTLSQAVLHSLNSSR